MLSPSWQTVESDYRFSRDLVRGALIYAQSNCDERDSTSRRSFQALLSPPQTGDETSPAALTRLTRDLFEHIMFLYKVPRASETAQWLEDRLDFFRRLQFEMDPGTAEILTELIGLFEAGRYDLLIDAVERYHDRHIACLDQVLERGFGRSYSTQKGQRHARRMGPQGTAESTDIC